MRSKIAASRALCYLNAKAIDLAAAMPENDDEKDYWQGVSDLLTAIALAGVARCGDLLLFANSEAALQLLEVSCRFFSFQSHRWRYCGHK